jgi:hypothetical protein
LQPFNAAVPELAFTPTGGSSGFTPATPKSARPSLTSATHVRLRATILIVARFLFHFLQRYIAALEYRPMQRFQPERIMQA